MSSIDAELDDLAGEFEVLGELLVCRLGVVLGRGGHGNTLSESWMRASA